MSEQKENCAKFEQLLDIIQEKYNIKRDVLFYNHYIACHNLHKTIYY